MTVNRSSEKSGLIFKIVFFCIFVFSLVLGMYLTIMERNVSNDHDVKIEYIDQWTVVDENGNGQRTGRMYVDERAYTEDFTIISRLPVKVRNDSVLCFLNRSDVSVYINGVLRKDFNRTEDTGIPGGSLKEFYITVPLNATDSGAVIKIVRYKTDWNPVVVPETFVTSTEGMYEYMLKKYGLSFAMETVLFVSALIVTLIGFVIRIWKRQTVSMLYAALGVLDVACWLIAVSQITPFCHEGLFR